MGDRSHNVEVPRLRTKDEGAPNPPSTGGVASASNLGDAPWMGNFVEAPENDELRSPAHYVTLTYFRSGKRRQKILPWVRGKRLQLYLKEANLIALRLRSRVVNTANQLLRMGHMPGPGEEIALLPPSVPLKFR